MAPKMPREGSVTGERAHLADLLTFAAGGNTDAFMRFYDLTCAAAYRAARLTCLDRACAEDLVCALYARAWANADSYPRSGLSPLAWLLAGITDVLLTDAGRGCPGAAGNATGNPAAWRRGA